MRSARVCEILRRSVGDWCVTGGAVSASHPNGGRLAPHTTRASAPARRSFYGFISSVRTGGPFTRRRAPPSPQRGGGSVATLARPPARAPTHTTHSLSTAHHSPHSEGLFTKRRRRCCGCDWRLSFGSSRVVLCISSFLFIFLSLLQVLEGNFTAQLRVHGNTDNVAGVKIPVFKAYETGQDETAGALQVPPTPAQTINLL